MEHWWQQMYLGNSVQDWVIAIATIVIAGTILYTIKKTILNWLKNWAAKTSSTVDDIIVAGIERSVIPLVYLFIIYGTINYLSFPDKIMGRIKVVFWIIVMFYILRSITRGFRHLIFRRIEEKPDSKSRKRQANGLILVLSIAIWVIGFVFLLDNLGYSIGTLIAGLGIGGIAIALAAQAILGDLFSYFVIYFDKPFEIGDFINFDDKSGTVEYIGLKSTRIRMLSGEQLVCSNKDLTDSRVHNYGRMPKRRVVFKIGVVHQTSAIVLKEIPPLVQKIIEQTNDVQFDRGHFMNLGQSSFEFEFVYYIITSDYTLYMDRQQEILLSIVKTFENKHIDLAYPTHTLYLEPQGFNGQETTVKDDEYSVKH